MPDTSPSSTSNSGSVTYMHGNPAEFTTVPATPDPPVVVQTLPAAQPWFNPVVRAWIKIALSQVFTTTMGLIATNGMPTTAQGWLAIAGADLGVLAALLTHSPVTMIQQAGR